MSAIDLPGRHLCWLPVERGEFVRNHVPISMHVLDDDTIYKVLTYQCVISLVEMAFAADACGRVTVWPVVGGTIENRNMNWVVKAGYMQLPSVTKEQSTGEILGLKAGAYSPSNSGRGLPNHNAAMLLIDPETGRPMALLAANAITTMRTAAAGAIAAKYFAPTTTTAVAVLGAGEQGHAQLEALLEVKRVKQVRVWSRSLESARTYAACWTKKGLPTVACSTAQEAVRGAQIIITATPSCTPILESAWVERGTHINAVGSDAKGKQELQAELVARARLIADKRIQSITIGEMQAPIAQKLVDEAHIEAELGEVCARLKKGRQNDDEVTIFDSSGVSFQDLVVADYLLHAAAQRSLGKRISV
jgi:ornithine cyclodeaminase/alanine dehydrogenase-like protein (mu-crystallin family)